MRACKAADGGHTAGLGCLEGFANADEAERGWAGQALAEAAGEGLPEGWVPSVEFCALGPGDQVVGMAQLRLALNDALLDRGGHIGYSVHPDFRRRGYAGLLLRRCLSQARQQGMSRVLLTCDGSNEASRRTILSCGGVLEDTRVDSDGAAYERYYVQLGH
ncbi:hypothetical protein AB656_05295 [Bifidobacterium actinocoloniiforme DSM 22766]|nr:hypothetical protein AB656_05295 [Bifidobacterium actinocoloniiforme DSM 22766]